MKTIPFLIALWILGVFFIPGSAEAEILCRSSLGGQCINLAAAAEAQVLVPGLEFLNSVSKPSELFSRLYTYGISLVGLAAFFMFTYGAILYMFVMEGSTNQAKAYMKNALFGLGLALISYLFLRIINPDLVTGFDITLPKIPGAEAPTETTGTSGGPTSDYVGKNLKSEDVEKARRACEDSGGTFTEVKDLSGSYYTCLHLQP